MNINRLAIYKSSVKNNLAADYVVFIRKYLLVYVGQIIDTNELISTSDIISEYDELILFNDTVFGPLYPLDDMFSKMAGDDCDLWRVTKHDNYFVVVKKNVFTDAGFVDILMEYGNDGFDRKFAEYIDTKGFYVSAYINTTPLDSIYDKHDHCLTSPYTLIKDYKMPFLKTAIFNKGIELSISMREEIREAFDFIDKCTEYNIDLVWQHIIRTCNMVDIKQNLSLNYVLPVRYEIAEYHNKNQKVAVIVHLAYPSLLDSCLAYLANIPEFCDVFVTTYAPEIKAILDKSHRIKSILVTNRGRDISALLIGCRGIIEDYDIICFTHDKKTSGGKGPYAVGKSYYYSIWENTLASREYINNILITLIENPRLGLLAPPLPLHGGYISVRGNEWTNCFDGVRDWAQKLGLACDISPDKPPFALGSSFWCRTAALAKLFEYPFSYDDFPQEPMDIDGQLGHIIERLFMFVTQDAGYYTANVINDSYAAIDIENMNHAIGLMNRLLRQNGFHWEKNWDEIVTFCNENPNNNLYIYGAGNIGRTLADMLTSANIRIAGFIVSDDHLKKQDINGCQVYRLSECDLSSSAVIVALGYRNTQEVKPYLSHKGCESILFLNENQDMAHHGSWLKPK